MNAKIKLFLVWKTKQHPNIYSFHPTVFWRITEFGNENYFHSFLLFALWNILSNATLWNLKPQKLSSEMKSVRNEKTITLKPLDKNVQRSKKKIIILWFQSWIVIWGNVTAFDEQSTWRKQKVMFVIRQFSNFHFSKIEW